MGGTTQVNGGGELFLGVDPGFKGGFALYDPKTRLLTSVMPMPLEEPDRDPRGGKNKRLKRTKLDGTRIVMFVEQNAQKIKRVVIEDVHAMPDQGVTSMFRFGQGLGILEGVFASFWLPVTKVSPAVWKSQMRLSASKDKARELAQALFPEFHTEFERKKDDGVAEAALIAVFGALYYKD